MTRAGALPALLASLAVLASAWLAQTPPSPPRRLVAVTDRVQSRRTNRGVATAISFSTAEGLSPAGNATATGSPSEAAPEGPATAPPRSLLDAAAALTQASCRLIGTRTLGVDYGLVRTGLAVTVGYRPKPLAILSDLNATELCHRVLEYARAERAAQLVVGLPWHKNGSFVEQTNLTVAFAAELTRRALATLGPDVPVLLWDERYTSKEAAARAHAADPGRFLYGTLDAEAACIILEHFFSENGQGALRLELDEDTRRSCLEHYEATRAEELRRLEQVSYERKAQLRWRKELFARRKIEETEASSGSENKKKKKRRRK